MLLFNHAKLMGSDPRASGKEYLVTTMFRMYDLNVNEVLEGEELDQVLTLFYRLTLVQAFSIPSRVF